MFRTRLVVSVVLIASIGSIALGQLGGSRVAGTDASDYRWWYDPTDPAEFPPLPLLDRRVTEKYITIDGRAEVRVQATEIRLVLAVNVEAKTGKECRDATQATIARLREVWAGIDIAPEQIAEDFIAAIPRYEWVRKQSDAGLDMVEEMVNVHLQTNVHLTAHGEAQAREAVAAALEGDFTDVVACDYWCRDLDAVKVKAREQALAAARDKAERLLGMLFAERPPVINVQERTTVKYPESLYETFDSERDNYLRFGYWGSSESATEAFRRYTYYRMPDSDADVTPPSLPNTPEIVVVSTVRLYYRSPAAGGGKDRRAEKPARERKSKKARKDRVTSAGQ